jgi:hypothetical protein
MKKVYLSIIGFSLLCRLQGYSQTRADSTGSKPWYISTGSGQNATDYNSRKLKLDEINLVSSYYSQDGNHSPITGGIGTERVIDVSNGIDLKLIWSGEHNKYTVSAGLGIDYHTSASAAYVSLSGASQQGGTRVYPSLDYSVENVKKGITYGVGAYVSDEYNYLSRGADLHYSVKTADRNGELGIKAQAYFDEVKLIYPSELIPKSTTTTIVTGPSSYTTASGNVISSNGSVIYKTSKVAIPSSARNTYTLSLSYSQMISQRLQVMFLLDGVAQNGYLGLPFHRVYFTTGDTAKVEKLPTTRYKLPLGVRLNYFLGDAIILRSYYRYYTDTWGTRAHTANLELAYKINPFFSIAPFYRFYTQTAANYFAPYRVHTMADEYYTSNYAYSNFNSNFYGVGFRVAPPKGVFGWQHLHDLELRYGHYTQTTDLSSNVISMNLGFK